MLDWNCHTAGEHLESYVLGRLSALELENLEEHLLVCEACSIRLDRTETYVRAMTAALRNFKEPESVWDRLRSGLAGLTAGSVPAWAGAAAVLMIAIGAATQIPRLHREPASNEVLTVRLEAMKGEPANSIAGHPLALLLDARGLPPAPAYRLQIVDQAGKSEWESTAAAEGETLRAVVPKRLGPGGYYVRVYGAGAEPLREFGLHIN